MSFRLNDLKKSVRKTKQGYQVAPYQLEGRAAAFRIEFLLQQFEGHLGCARRLLDPDSLLDFVGDARLGRGLLATLAQWYRMRARTFAEALPDGGAGMLERGVAGPVDLRAWLYAAVNRGAGYLDPEAEVVFWQAQSRALGVRREALQKLMLLDRPEEAVLVRTGPPPTAADVIAAYNARAQTTLLRSAMEVTLLCDAPPAEIGRAARAWPNALGVEWRVEGQALHLSGRADAMGSWTRHGRLVERAALELLSLPALDVRELQGRVEIGERTCCFGLECGGLTPHSKMTLPEQIQAFANSLRREREPGGEWGIRRATHLIGVSGGIFLPHLELRWGDLSVYLRLVDPDLHADLGASLDPFRCKTPVALVGWPGVEADRVTLQLAGAEPMTCPPGAVLATLAEYLEPVRQAAAAPLPERALKRAA